MDALEIMRDTLTNIKKYAPQIEKAAGVEVGTIKKCTTELTRQRNNPRKKYCTPAEFNTLGPTPTHTKHEIGAMVVNGDENESWLKFSYYVISLLNQMAFEFVRPGEPDTACPRAIMSGYNPKVTLSYEDKEWLVAHPDNGAVIRYLAANKAVKAEKKKERKEERELPAMLDKLNKEKQKSYKIKKDKLRAVMKARLKSNPKDEDAEFWVKADAELQKHDKERKRQ